MNYFINLLEEVFMIKYDETKRVFHLTNGSISYYIYVNSNEKQQAPRLGRLFAGCG